MNLKITDLTDNTLETTLDFYVSADNTAPTLIEDIPTQESLEDEQLILNLNPYFQDLEGDELNYDIYNISNAELDSIIEGIAYLTPTEYWNGVIEDLYVIANDGEFQTFSNFFQWTVFPVNNPPEQIAAIPIQNSDEDETNVINMLNYVYNPDGDQMSYVVSGLENSNYNTNLNNVNLTPNPNWFGTESDLEIIVSNNAGSITLNTFDWNIESVNDYPQVNPDSDEVNQGGSVTTNVLANDTDNLDPNGAIDPTSVSIVSFPSHGSVNVNAVNGEITYTPANGFFGNDSYTYKAGDNGTPQLFDNAVVNLTVNEVEDEVYIKVMDLMTDTLLQGCTLHIGNNDYYLANGDISLELTGSYEVNATHPNTLDGKPRGPPGEFFPTYNAIQRPGQNSNVEQQAYGDQSSIVNFTGNADTLYVYKIMDDFNMIDVGGIVGSGNNGETHRFSDNDLNAPAWFNLNYTAPTDQTRNRVLHWINDQLPPATKGKLNMVYEEDNTTPSSPYLEMAIDPGFNASNSTSSTNNIINWCYAHWPHNSQSFYTLGIEICQAVGDLNDIGGNDPPILSWENGVWVINHTGQECFHLLYNFDPGTKF